MNVSSGNNFHIEISKNKNSATLHLGGNFNFWSHVKFKEAYLQLLNDSLVRAVEVDFSRVEHLDSSALGMLLILRDRVQVFGKTLSLIRPNPLVTKVFDIANFHRMFTIH
jgi:anti-anti-sigma factor